MSQTALTFIKSGIVFGLCERIIGLLLMNALLLWEQDSIQNCLSLWSKH